MCACAKKVNGQLMQIHGRSNQFLVTFIDEKKNTQNSMKIQRERERKKLRETNDLFSSFSEHLLIISDYMIILNDYTIKLNKKQNKTKHT